jgi:hypothetical protein
MYQKYRAKSEESWDIRRGGGGGEKERDAENSILVNFVIFLTALSVFQTKQRRMIEWLINNELERIWKEEVVALLEIQSRHISHRSEENHEKILSG